MKNSFTKLKIKIILKYLKEWFIAQPKGSYIVILKVRNKILKRKNVKLSMQPLVITMLQLRKKFLYLNSILKNQYQNQSQNQLRRNIMCQVLSTIKVNIERKVRNWHIQFLFRRSEGVELVRHILVVNLMIIWCYLNLDKTIIKI